jgi:putative transposase
MGYFSIRDAAKAMSCHRDTLYQRPDIQAMLASTTPQIAPRGLKLYPTSAFPADIKVALMTSTAPNQDLEDLRIDRIELSHKQLNPTAATEVAARLEILNIRDTWSEAAKYQTQYEADIAFCNAALAGDIPDLPLEQLAWGQYKGLSRATLCRMRQKRKKGQIGELTRTVGHRKGTGVIDKHESLNRFILGQILTHPQQSIDQLYVKMQTIRFPEMPSLPTVRRWAENWIAEHQSEYLSVVNPDAWRNRHQVAFGSYSEGVNAPNQLWEIDSSPTDTMLTDGRSTEVALIDVYTRRVMVKIFKTSKSEAIMTLIRLAVIAWGIPTSIKSDQGKDYCSEAVTRFCAELRIELRHCQPYSPWQKPHVERFFGSLNHAQADLPGYIGYDVAMREAIRSQHSFAANRRKPDLGAGDKGTITPIQFQSWLDDWAAKYNSQPHSETRKIPDESFAELDHPERCQDLRKLDILIGCAGERKIGKKGIRWQSYEFFHAELSLHEGKEVRIYNDVNDLSRLVVYDLEGVFICEAICFELRGISTYDVAREATAKQNAHKAEFKKTAAKLKREANKLRPNVEKIHEQREAVAAPPVLATVIPITQPKPIELVRNGDDMYVMLLTAYRLGKEFPTDFIPEELVKIRRLRELQKLYCLENLKAALGQDPRDHIPFNTLLDRLLEDKSHVIQTRAC